MLLVIFVSVINAVHGSSQWTRWSQLGSCSVTCGAGEIWQKRTCIGESPNPVCPGAQQRTSRCQKLACPENECNCGCSLRDKSGNIRSVSPSRKSLDCTWDIVAKPGHVIRLSVNNFVLKYGNLRIVGPNKVYRSISKRRNRHAQIPFTVQSIDNVLNLTLYYHKVMPAGDGVKLEATYETIEVGPGKIVEDTDSNSGINIPTVAGIATCVFIIILVTCLIVYRKTFSQRKNNANNETEDGVDENCGSSTSASLKHGGVDLFWDQREAVQNQKQSLPIDRHKLSHSSADSDHQRLLTNPNNVVPTVRINPTAVPMYVNTGKGQIGYNPQYNQPSYILIPQTATMINESQINCMTREKPVSGVFNA